MTQSILSHVLDTARTHGADHADVILIESQDVAATYRLGHLENLERSESLALGLRVLVGKKQAIISSNDIKHTTLDTLVERAITMAKIANDDPYATFATSEQLIHTIPDIDSFSSYEPSVGWLKEQALVTEDAARSVTGITNSEGATAAHGSNTVSLATSQGFFGQFSNSRTTFSVSVLAGDSHTGMERDSDFTTACYLDDLASPQSVGESAAHKAVKRLHPKQPITGTFPVVYHPDVGRSLLRSFASAVNGSSIARGTSFLQGAMGDAIFSKDVNIIDDPHLKRGLASKPFDAEGIGGKKCSLIDHGVLQSWLLDLRTAKQLGLTTTGHASRSTAGAPYPSSTNLYMENGSLSPDNLIGSIEQGIFLTDVFGMGVNGVTGDYSQGAAGFWIEHGEIAYPINEFTVASNLKDMFQTLTPANDLTFKYGSNVPSIRIESMMVAGSG